MGTFVVSPALAPGRLSSDSSALRAAHGAIPGGAHQVGAPEMPMSSHRFICRVATVNHAPPPRRYGSRPAGAPGTLINVPSLRVYAQTPTSDVPTNLFPRPERQFAAGPKWKPRRAQDIAESDSNAARSASEPAPHVDFSRIAVYSTKDRQALEAASSAGTIDAETGRNMRLRLGEVPSARAVSPPSAPLPLPLQARLEVGSVADPLETEADAAVDRVMRTPAPAFAVDMHTSTVADEAHQRMGEKCDEDNKLHRKAEGAPVGGTAAPPIVHDALRSSGTALDERVRAFMGPAFRTRFRPSAGARGCTGRTVRGGGGSSGVHRGAAHCVRTGGVCARKR